MSRTSSSVPLTRRVLIGSAVAGGMALAGCGGTDNNAKPSGAATSGTPASGTRKRGGTLRFASSSLGEATAVDTHYLNSATAIKAACFDSLVDRDHANKLQMVLAEEFGPEGDDLTTWTIRLRDGLEFHNGKTVGAEDVMFSIRRILDPKNPGAASVLLAAIDAKRMKKLDARTVRLHLKYPDSGLLEGFTGSFAGIVPVGFDPKKPIGAGPFKHEHFTPHQRWAGTRHANYWQPGRPYLDRLELINFTNPTAALNGLLSGQVDGLDHLQPPNLPRVKSRKDLNIVVSETGAFQPIGMNARKGAQFEDPRVRKAFKLMLDRKQLVASVYGGYGATGNDVGVWPQWDAACDPSLPEPQQDLEQARSLLKAAGKENMTVQLRVGELVPGMMAAAQVLQQQAKQVGVTIKLDVVTDPAQFYTDAYFEAQLQTDWTQTGSMYSTASYYWLSHAGYNSTGYSNPRVDALFKQSQRYNGARYDDAMHEMSRIIADDGPWMVWGRQSIIDVYNKKFTGVVPDASGDGFGGNHFDEISLA